VHLVLDRLEYSPGSHLTGELSGAPPEGADVTIYARTTTPSGERAPELSTTRLLDGRFDLQGPRFPQSASGPLLGVQWWIEAHSPDGRESAAVPFDLVAHDVTVESLTNDDLDEPHRGNKPLVAIISTVVFVVGLIGSITSFATGETFVKVLAAVIAVVALVRLWFWLSMVRQHAILGHVRYRIDPSDDALDCMVRLHPRSGSLPADVGVTATLLVVEGVSQRSSDGGWSRREETVASKGIELRPGPNHTWHGSIALDSVAGAPLSRSNSIDSERWEVSWIVRVVIAAPMMPDVVKPMVLIAYPTGMPRDLAGHRVAVPATAR
jgi:hypothetical protein